MSTLSPSAERALCAYLTQSLLNEEADRYDDLMGAMRTYQTLPRAHINPRQNPYIPLDFSVPEVPTLPDWYDSMDDFDRPDFL